MKNITKILLLLFLTGISNFVLANNTDNSNAKNIYFIENKGQIVDINGNLHPEIFFKTELNNSQLYFTKNGVRFYFYKYVTKNNDELTKEQLKALQEGNMAYIDPKIYFYRVDLEISGANTDVEIYAEEQKETKNNYYLPHCPDGITGVSSFGKIIYKNIYQNIDLHFYFKDGQLKYDFIIHKGGNVNDIKLQYKGSSNTIIREDGSLFVETELGNIIEKTPEVFSADGTKIKATFSKNNNYFSFSVDNYNNNIDLIIDPSIHWSTYFNNNYSSDTWTRPVVDSQGNLFNTGYTYASTFPIINPGSGAWIDPSKDGTVDLIIVKFDSNHTLVWSTYYGGDNSDYVAGYTDYGKALAIDNNDNIYIAGLVASTTTIFPTFNPGGGAWYQDQTKIYGETPFLLKFSNTGERLWATMFQHENANTNNAGMRINGIVSDGTKLYFTGQTYKFNSNDIPLRTLSGAYNNSTFVGAQDPFIGRFSSTLSLEWNTYLNSGNTANTAYSQGVDLVIDGLGNLFFVGRESNNSTQAHLLINPGGGAYYQSTNAGDQDLIITKFNSSMQAVWSTYYGGNDQDIPSMVNCDNNNNFWIVCRNVRSTNWPVLDPGGGAYYQSTKAASGTWGTDGSILKFNNSGVRQWATYYGGAGTDVNNYLTGIGFDQSNNVYVFGNTGSATFPVQNETGSYYDGTLSGSLDAVFLKFDNSGVRQWATFYGGSGNESLYSSKGLVMSNACETQLYTFCGTGSSDFPTTDPGGGALYENTNATTNANAIIMFTETTGSLSSPPTSVTASINPVCTGTSTTLTINGGVLGSGGIWQWYTGSCGGTLVGSGTSITVSPATSTTYYVRAEGDCNTTTCVSITVNVVQNSDAGTSGTTAVCQDDTPFDLFTVLGGTPESGGTWTNSSGNTVSNIFDPATQNSDIFTYTVTGTSPCPDASSTVDVTVNPLPTVSFTGLDTSYCGTGNFILTGSFAPNGVFTGTDITDNGDGTAGFFPQTTGSYSVTYTYTDANGCTNSQTQSTYIYTPPSVQFVGLDTGYCHEANSVNIIGNHAPEGSFMGTGINDNGDGTAIFTPDSIGQFNIVYTYTDNNGCTGSDTQAVFVYENPWFNNISITDVTVCSPPYDGIVSYEGTGGNGNYLYSFNGGLFTTDTIADSLATGIYTISVMDSYSCYSDTSIEVSGNTGFYINQINVSGLQCHGDSSGQIIIQATDGYNYSIDAGNTFQTDSAFYNLSGGIYYIQVISSSGCTDFDTITVTEPPEFNYTYLADSTLCYGDSSGKITITLTGGTSPYTYTWSPSGYTETNNIYSGLPAGTYSLSVTDSNGCEFSIPKIDVMQPDSLIVQTNVANTSCFNTADGTATISVSGGTAPYTYSWENNYTGYQNTNLGTGIYNVTITDKNNCQFVETLTIGSPPEINISEILAIPSCKGNNDGHIIVSVTGGMSPYTYSWNNEDNDSIVDNVIAGTYYLTLTDNNNCKITKSYDLPDGTGDCLIIPNLFTPNNDGYNDTWQIENIGLFPNAVVEIYNRWGDIVFESEKGYPSAWDGTWNGKQLPFGAYVFILDLGNGEEPINGIVTLKR